MSEQKLDPDAGPSLVSRRAALKLSAGAAAVSAFGLPSIVRAASDTIKIGHLTPKTGFLGALGVYATKGMELAVEQLNAAGGVNGMKFELHSEDSINPDTAATKAQRMISENKVDFLIGEISSASALAISQVAARNKKLYYCVGARSDVLRGKNCSEYMFCTDIPNTVMVNAVGSALLRRGMVKGKRFMTLTADYVFGHDLLAAAKKFFADNDATLVTDALVATDVTDFSPFLQKVRQVKPDVVCLNLAGNQTTNFVKQYAEFGLTFPTVGFNLNTASAWAAGLGNLTGTWPTSWYDTLDTPGSKAYVAAFQKKFNTMPENQSWVSFISMKIAAEVIAKTKSLATADMIKYLETEAKFDILKERKAYFRKGDHQLIQEAYPFTVNPNAKNVYDMIVLGNAVPGPNQPLDSIYPTVAEGGCKL
ncbi:ABC transporter substrate-binding protein [Solirhodobacter olei]|uniref:ABC transporter substrate-binding protein n=1 Tax=Solirhodobacter olei TaxID=2493082 RepID=UPI000FD95B58|nr:ABC transporter substrate-binding protein [Solirhodobacter olei]